MLVVAHRGANREALENSWRAYELAVSAGAHRIELDVQWSRDGQLAIMHDDSLFKMTGKHLHISEMSRDEIERLQLHDGTKIPFLEDVISRLIGQIELNIEIKPGNDEVVDAVVGLINKYNAEQSIVVSSFQPSVIHRLADCHPDIQRACLWEGAIQWPYLSYLAPNIMMMETRSTIFHPDADLVTEAMMDYAHAKGWKVIPWVKMAGEENDRYALWSFLRTVKVAGLCTNYPRELVQWLKEIEKYEQRISD